MKSRKLVPQAHGGALLSGGVKGHRGAGGRPRSAIRREALDGADVAVKRVRKIMECKQSHPRDVIAAASLLLKYGLGPDSPLTCDQLRQFLGMVRVIIEEECDTETGARIVARIRKLPTP